MVTTTMSLPVQSSARAAAFGRTSAAVVEASDVVLVDRRRRSDSRSDHDGSTEHGRMLDEHAPEVVVADDRPGCMWRPGKSDERRASTKKQSGRRGLCPRTSSAEAAQPASERPRRAAWKAG